MIKTLIYTTVSNDVHTISKSIDNVAEKYKVDCSISVCCMKEEIDRIIRGNADYDILCIGLDSFSNRQDVVRLCNKYCNSRLVFVLDDYMKRDSYFKNSNILKDVVYRTQSTSDLDNKFKEWIIELNEYNNEDYYIVNNDNILVKVPINEILYFEASNKKIIVKTITEEYCICDTLKRIEKNLNVMFVRTHRSYIINKRHVVKLNFSEGYAHMCNNDNVPISNKFKTIIKKEIIGNHINLGM